MFRISASRVQVYWPIDDAWYSNTVGNTADSRNRVAYGNGDMAHLDMSKEKYKSSHTELAVQMQSAALDSKMIGNYRPKVKAFIDFCDSEGRQWLPAEEATVRLYIAHLLAKGTVQAASMQLYLSPINNHHEDTGFRGPTKGRGVSRAVKGMASMQVEAAAAAGEERTSVHLSGVYFRHLWPAGHGEPACGGSWAEQLLAAAVEPGKIQSAQANDWVQKGLGKLGRRARSKAGAVAAEGEKKAGPGYGPDLDRPHLPIGTHWVSSAIQGAQREAPPLLEMGYGRSEQLPARPHSGPGAGAGDQQDSGDE
ncbi:hypothetical protein CYMTET_4648 [Cymbomonas tetramitiformis]|uniref:Uncharacterized protein n=1 Tax=Cymbomonas tetramitiformis TaxID=36881 RepID=A0AAE0H0R6_9CHLO|nr:hypothetical protein CYMTET_4648 [Cymbomonas tetramitiformis]